MCMHTHKHTQRERLGLILPVLWPVLYVLPGLCPGFPGVSTWLWGSLTGRTLNWVRRWTRPTWPGWMTEGIDTRRRCRAERWVDTCWVNITVLTGTGDPRGLRPPGPGAGRPRCGGGEKKQPVKLYRIDESTSTEEVNNDNNDIAVERAGEAECEVKG